MKFVRARSTQQISHVPFGPFRNAKWEGTPGTRIRGMGVRGTTWSLGFILRVFIVTTAVAASLSVHAIAQAAPSAIPLITFTLDFPASDPPHYSISVDVHGRAKYESTVKADGNAANTEDETEYRYEFEMSAVNRDRIFGWAKQAKYFQLTIDSGNKKLAFTGDKTISYQDDLRSFTARYNYSNLEPVRELTTLFQDISTTLEHGRKLTYFHQYQKLALDEELKQLEEQSKSSQLAEIQSLAPILQSIVDDQSVINVVRARARELIRLGSQSGLPR